MSAETTHELSRLFLGCLLFKLGGEIVLTAEEIDEIKQFVGGVQILLTPDNAFVLRTKTPEAYEHAVEQIKNL